MLATGAMLVSQVQLSLRPMHGRVLRARNPPCSAPEPSKPFSRALLRG